MTEFRVNDVDLQEFLHSFTDGDGKLPSDFELLKREGHYLIHGDASRRFCLKEREIYLRDTMENLLAKSLCFFSNMPISYAVHVKASGRADICILDNKRLSMEIKAKQVKGKSITVRYKDGMTDKGALETERYIKGPFGEKVNTVQYACVADTLLHLPERAKGFFRSWLKDIKLLPAIRQGSFYHGMPDEDRIAKFKKLMEAERYIRITPEQAAQAKKFDLPLYFLQNNGMVNYAHDVLSDLWEKKGTLFLMKKDWAKMLDILVNERPVQCPREILIAMKMEAKQEASIVKNEKDKETFAVIADKLACFLELTEKHNLTHIFTEQGKGWVLPDFISETEKERLSRVYRFPEKENSIVADRSARYLDAAGR